MLKYHDTPKEEIYAVRPTIVKLRDRLISSAFSRRFNSGDKKSHPAEEDAVAGGERERERERRRDNEGPRFMETVASTLPQRGDFIPPGQISLFGFKP